MLVMLLLFWSICAQNVLSTAHNLFNRLNYYEIVHITQKQLNKIDDHAIYPSNGELEFDAFGRHYHLWFHKNTELFHDNFTSHYHRNKEKQMESIEATNCYYLGVVLMNNISSKAAFSACRGQGIRGWIYAYDEVIVIRPQSLIMHNINKGISINDAYIVYKYNDVDRSDYHTKCGVDHIHHHDHHHRHLLRRPQSNQHVPSLFTSSSGIRYIELAVVNDPAMVQHYVDLYGTEDWLTELQSATIRMINSVQQYYLDTLWGDNIGIIHVVLTAIYYISDWNDYGSNYAPRAMLNYVSSNDETVYCDDCSPSMFCASCLGRSDYYQIDYSDYLTKFHRFRTSELQNYDNAHLFSYYDFFSTVIGLASLPGMCITDYSGGIEQTTYDDEYNGNIIAHEMGHNFNMQHDGQGNDCDAEQYIMASVGSPYGFRPHSFSSCSIDEINEYFTLYPSVLTCLDNQPQDTKFGLCGNGVVEEGETCDCGAADCSMIDKCCDGALCSLYGDAHCSMMDDCCHDCKIKGNDAICRELSTSNTCDMQEEYCDGISPVCPYDKKYIEGTECSVVNSHYQQDNISFGYCYYGECVSIEEQCSVHGSNTLSNNCGWDPIWRTSLCATNLKCGYTFDESQCNSIFDVVYNVGTPCYTNNNKDVPMQCVGNICLSSSEIYTYVYITGGWSACSIPCRDENSTEIGYQTRSVVCAMQDGTVVDDIICEVHDVYKPSLNRTCNDFICDFCAPLVENPHVCYPNGECDGNAGICLCDWGYGGEFCKIEPSLYFIGITSHAYLSLNGITVSERADPCNVIEEFYDAPSKTLTLSVSVDTLSTIYIGSVVGIRWNSTGALSQLSVGMIRVDHNDTYWPFYVGTSLATDNQECQMVNASTYDPCYQDISCNDFSFIVPDNAPPGYYKILIRFNAEYHIESDVFTLECTNNICNATGNGRCGAYGDDQNVCQCDEYWYGDRCDESLCKPWTFTSHSCDDDVFCENYNKPKCFGGTCDPTQSAHELCECDAYTDGTYCELPNNHCNQITDIEACNNQEWCTFDSTHGCVYTDCFALDNDECTSENIFEYNNMWPIYCEWNDNGYCDRISCNINNVPICHNSAVRRPLLDSTSICYAWYCDCHTTPNDQYWTKSTPTTLVSSIKSNYPWNTALNTSYVTDIDIFTCSKCGLSCLHDSVANIDCTMCDQCDRNKWEGIECNHLFWIGYFKLNIQYQTVMNSYDAFISAITQDLAYFFSVQSSYIIIWDVKPVYSDDNDNVIVYFKYLFDPNVDDGIIQSVGGDVMMNARHQLSDEYAPSITRGFITQYTDFAYALDWCLPTKEVCNHEMKEVDYLALFGYCVLFSYIFLGGIVVVWIVGRKCYKRKQKKQFREYSPHKEAEQPLSPILQQVIPPQKRNYGTYSELMQREGYDQDAL